MRNIYSFTFKEFEEKVVELNLKKFVASQVFEWVYKQYVNNWDKMTNLSQEVKKILSENISIGLLEIVEVKKDPDGTVKMLYKLEDGNVIEMAIINFEFGWSGCCSTQIGCNMGCKFCASGLLKKKRNLTSCEIVQEIVGANKYLKENNLQPMGSISFMGIGEPFDNIENVIATVKLLNDKKTLNISTRNFTLSTCGLIDKLPLIIKELPQTNVAISLHAPTDEIRSRIMPVNNAFNVKQVIDAAKDYTKKTRNDITFQYALMQGINDSNECAEQLSKLLKDVNCHVTLIEYNENPEFDIHASKNVANFKNILKKNNISFSQRLKRGKDIDAACGTMRANYDKSKK